MFRHAINKCCYVHRLPRNDSILQLYNKLPRNGCLQIYITPIRQQQRGAGSSRDLKPCPPVKSKKKYYYTLGILLVGAAGVIGYAKYDPDFRQVLTETVPAADGVIKFVFEEEKPYKDNINDIYNYLKERTNQIYANLLGNSDELEDTKAKPKEVVKQPEEKRPSVVESGEKAVEKEETEAEKALKMAAQTLILAINALQDAIRDEAESISKLVDESVRTDDPSTIWTKIDEITESKQITIDAAEKKYQLVKGQYEKRRGQLPSQNNVKSTLDEVAGALKALEMEKAHLAAALKFAQEVENLRGRINRELKTLFPNLKLAEKGSKLTLPEVDLFMLYAYNTISNFQQEIKKLDDARDAKLREIVERTKTNVGDIEARIEQELQKERAKYEQEFEKRKAEIEENCDKEVMEQFKRQTMVHHKVLEDALEDKEVEIERRMQGQLLKQYEDEKKKYDSSLLAMVSKMKVLNEAVENRMKQEKKADQARELWGACQELSKALKASKTNDSEQVLNPLEKYIKSIRKAAVKGDDFVDSVIASIPHKAICRGVFSEDMLRDRFEKVEKVAKRVAQVPEGGTSLPLVFLAFLQSLFIVQAIEPIPSHELANQPIDTAKLNNFDILQRARYWMERGDFEQALRYMNLLKGGAKAVAKDWMEETTILLETQQAANVLKAYAIASGLIYL